MAVSIKNTSRDRAQKPLSLTLVAVVSISRDETWQRAGSAGCAKDYTALGTLGTGGISCRLLISPSSCVQLTSAHSRRDLAITARRGGVRETCSRGERDARVARGRVSMVSGGQGEDEGGWASYCNVSRASALAEQIPSKRRQDSHRTLLVRSGGCCGWSHFQGFFNHDSLWREGDE
jgi:hypothetical protein